MINKYCYVRHNQRKVFGVGDFYGDTDGVNSPKYLHTANTSKDHEHYKEKKVKRIIMNPCLYFLASVYDPFPLFPGKAEIFLLNTAYLITK